MFVVLSKCGLVPSSKMTTKGGENLKSTSIAQVRHQQASSQSIGDLYEFGIESRGIDKNAGLSDEDKKDVIAAVISATTKPGK